MRVPRISRRTTKNVIKHGSHVGLWGSTFTLDRGKIVKTNKHGVVTAVFDAETLELKEFYDRHCGRFVRVESRQTKKI